MGLAVYVTQVYSKEILLEINTNTANPCGIKKLWYLLCTHELLCLMCFFCMCYGDHSENWTDTFRIIDVNIVSHIANTDEIKFAYSMWFRRLFLKIHQWCSYYQFTVQLKRTLWQYGGRCGEESVMWSLVGECVFLQKMFFWFEPLATACWYKMW